VSVAGLTLSEGQIYYFSVKAVNGNNIESSATNSDGATVGGGGSNNGLLKVWPNPVINPRPGNPVTFSNLSSRSTVKIYTLSGKLVKKLAESGGAVSWDGKNMGGKAISSGLYLYIVTNSQGSRTIGKIAITR